ncbi:MAG TPA: hypothetical protein VKY59_11110 [Spirillospora sp.]|nr:hypothetical protein [Spirillospora sp.]
MLAANLPALTLGRVVLRLPPGVRDSQRWQASRALSHVTLNAGLPPRAILVVRQLPDVAPGTLLTNGGAGQWNEAAQSWLRDCWRRASRPAIEPVSAMADAVWFADEAEWLACLSWDAHQGTALARWWWQTWLRQHRYDAVGSTLYALWQNHPRWLPQALTLLYERQASGWPTLLLRLSPQEARHIRQQVERAYDLPPWSDTPTGSETLLQALPGDVQRTVRDLPQENMALAVLCFALTRAPAVLQGRRQFGRPSTEPVRKQTTLDAAAPSRRPDTTSTLDSGASRTEGRFIEPAQDSVTSAQGHITHSAPRHPLADDEALPVTNASRPLPVSEQNPAESLHTVESGIDADSGSPPLAADTRMPDEALLPAVDVAAAASISPQTVPGLATHLGGLWYLVNLLIELEWLDHDGPVLNAWQRLAWLARGLLDDTPPDPVWEILAALAEEEADEIALQTWLDAALPQAQEYLRARLEEPAALIEALRDPAVLYVTRTHIDVVFSLDQIRLALRMAGLDRDPGWVPQLARVISLHYE